MSAAKPRLPRTDASKTRLVAHRFGLTTVNTPSLVENLPSGLENVEFGS